MRAPLMFVVALLACSADRAAREAASDRARTRVGALHFQEVRRVIRSHADEVRGCYEQRLILDPRLQGRVTLTWRIEGDGTASHVSTVRGDTTLPSEEVSACIARRVLTWRFPEPKAGMAVVTYPWILRAGPVTPATPGQPESREPPAADR